MTSERNNDTHSDEAAAEAGETANTTRPPSPPRRSKPKLPNPPPAKPRKPKQGDEERVLGIDVESPLLVTTAVVVSVLLAGLVWRRRDRSLLVAIAIFGAGFAVLDIAEVAHQLDEAHNGLALLAGLIAALHASTAVLAVHQATRTADTAREPLTS